MQYEMLAANGVVDPSQLTVTWRDVGGLDSIVAVLKVRPMEPPKPQTAAKLTPLSLFSRPRKPQETIVLPFTRPDIFNSSSPLLHPPSGEHHSPLPLLSLTITSCSCV